MDYSYNSEGPDANSKSRKSFGKPRSTDGWIKPVNKYGCRVRQNRWVLRRLRLGKHPVFQAEACTAGSTGHNGAGHLLSG